MGTTNTFDVEAIVRAYAETLLWQAVDYDEEGNEIIVSEEFDIDDIPQQIWNGIRRDVEEFIQGAADDLQGLSEEVIGHNLLLTRNGHGSGFWSIGLGARGERLTERANRLGEHHICVIDGELVDY